MDLKGFEKLLNAWQSQLKRTVLPGAQRRLGVTLLEHFKGNFQRGGYEKGESFVPWAKRKYQYNHKPLVDTGKLLDGYRVVPRRGGVEIVNEVSYAQYHHEGTKELPARPLLYASKKLEKEVQALLTKDLKKLFTR